MAKPITIPNTFASATSAIPLSQLDQDFSTLANATNDLATYSNYVADTGAADAFIVNYPANTNTSSLTTGLRLQFKAANANTGASTLNVQVNGASIGTAAIRLTDGSALPANTIIAGALVDVMYDGTNFQIMNDPSGGQEIITNLTLSGNLTVAGTSTFTGNVTGNVVNTTTSTITNLTSSNVTITGGSIDNISITNLTSLTVDGNTTLGDASGDTLTINGTTVTTPNGLNFDSNTFVIDATNNRVGIGTASPSSNLTICSNNTAVNTDLTIGPVATRAWSIQTSAFDGTGYPLRIGPTFAGGFGTNLIFATGSGDAERMRITSTGNVGIGTSSPSHALDVAGSGTRTIRAFCTDTSGANIGRVSASFGSGASTSLEMRSGLGYTYLVSTGASDPMLFGTNSTERMRIDASGRVGIGTSSPDDILDIQTPSNNYAMRLRASASNFALVRFVNNANNNTDAILGTPTSNTLAFYTNGFSERMRIDSSGNVGIGTSNAAGIGASYRNLVIVGTAGGCIDLSDSTSTVRATISSDNSGGNALFIDTRTSHPIIFRTTSGVVERMRITSGGELLIGATSYGSVDTNGCQLSGNGVVLFTRNTSSGFVGYWNIKGGATGIQEFYLSGVAKGSITVSAGGTAYNTTSDYRLKENIQPMTGALAKVSQLKPCTYTWKVDGSAGQGFIAHELQAVVPDCVTGEKDAVDEEGKPIYQGVDTSFLVATLTAAIQELKTELDATKAEVALLKSK